MPEHFLKNRRICDAGHEITEHDRLVVLDDDLARLLEQARRSTASGFDLLHNPVVEFEKREVGLRHYEVLIIAGIANDGLLRVSAARGLTRQIVWECRGHTEQRSAGGDSDLQADLVGFVQLRRGRWAPPV